MLDIRSEDAASAELRARALSRLRARQGFRVHLFAYVGVNMMLVGVWASTGGPFWPVFPMVGWGFGVLGNAWLVYWRPAIGEDELRREMEYLSGEEVG